MVDGRHERDVRDGRDEDAPNRSRAEDAASRVRADRSNIAAASPPTGSEPAAHRGVIAPVPPGVVRPLWSVMIPTFNCAAYLRDTLASVLEQDPGRDVMQIEVVDDHSTRDDPAAVVAELGRGRVEFFRQPRNTGVTTNLTTALQRSRGHLVHLLTTL
jgi:hypothetical protein